MNNKIQDIKILIQDIKILIDGFFDEHKKNNKTDYLERTKIKIDNLRRYIENIEYDLYFQIMPSLFDYCKDKLTNNPSKSTHINRYWNDFESK